MSINHVHHALRLARRRDGIVLAAELAAEGVDRHAVARLASGGVLQPLAPGVLSVASHPPSWRQMVWLAIAIAGQDAVVSHRAGAALWELIDEREALVEVTVPRWSGQDHHTFLVHRSTDLTPDQVRSISGMPVTDIDRTLIDLAGVVDAETLEAAFDNALRRRLTTAANARATLERLARRGRRGAGPYRALLDSRDALAGVSETRFEVRLARLLRRFGLPEPVRQLPLHDARGFIGRFDFAYPPAKVLLEADSERWHMDTARFHADRMRRNRAEALGWRVPTFTWKHVTNEPEFVARTIDQTLVAAGWDWRRDPDGASVAPRVS